MTLEQQWIEYDFNPFILFSHNGKIISLNSEAQFLLSATSSKELFELATTYASVSYGFKTIFIDIEFGRYKFFGLTVGYIDDEKIGIKLYRLPTLNQNILKKPNGEITNIYTVIDLCISSNSIGKDINFIKDFDPTIPEIVVESNKLIKVLNLIYKCFLENNDEIITKVFFRIGEYIKYDNKKYPLFSIEVSSKILDKEILEDLKKFIKTTYFYMDINQTSITINLPIITS